MFIVVEQVEWPKVLEIAMMFTSNELSIVAHECRYGIITTNGKSLYFQGV